MLKNRMLWVCIFLFSITSCLAAQPTAAAPQTASTWTDSKTKLTWAGQDNGSDVNWNQANDYCRNLRLGAYSNWRLPNINELRRIYDQSQDVNGYHIKAGMELSKGWQWSNSPGKYSGEFWIFYFGDGSRLSGETEDGSDKRALCVRDSRK
jgi:hypothetical protein